MENLDQNELIEGYLNGSLTNAEQKAIENRLAADPDFQAEVELHRQLHEEFADPKKLALRNMLNDILQEPPPVAKYGWLRNTGIALAILLVGWIGWRWLSPSPVSAPDAEEEIQSAPQPTEPIDTLGKPSDPTTSPEKAPEHPIAMADPAAFAPNRDFEDRLSGGVRAVGGSAEMQSPAIGANFTSENGFIKITFRGTAPANANDSSQPLMLKIYDNKPASNQPLLRLLPAVRPENSSGNWAFSSIRRLRLKPGLYYFILERQADEELLFIGKFTVTVGR